jgi:fermentation-respiration switch protein FrsA (DUF1100 family)
MLDIRRSFAYWLILLLIPILFSACSPPGLGGGPALPALQDLSPLGGTPTGHAAAANTQLPPPSVIVLPSATPAPSLTPTATTTPTRTPHPMSIESLRQMDFPGSDITIVETLEPGANYYRYYASYESQGLTIYALLTVPYSEPPPGGFPAIVFNHGYIPPEVYRTTERYIAYVDSLASNGYVVFRIDYRGHDRSEGEATGAYGDPGYAMDVLNAVASLQRFPQVDPGRIGMWGHSMGGYLTLRAMVVSPEIKAGVIWAGVVGSYPDLLARWRRGDGPTPTPSSSRSRRWRTLFLEQFGSPEQNPDFWNSISANSYLGDLSGPIQLHHGTADESVPLEFSEILYQQLQAAGQTAELYTYPGDDHNISNAFSIAMTNTIEFFNRYLKAGQ